MNSRSNDASDVMFLLLSAQLHRRGSMSVYSVDSLRRTIHVPHLARTDLFNSARWESLIYTCTFTSVLLSSCVTAHAKGSNIHQADHFQRSCVQSTDDVRNPTEQRLQNNILINTQGDWFSLVVIYLFIEPFESEQTMISSNSHVYMMYEKGEANREPNDKRVTVS